MGTLFAAFCGGSNTERSRTMDDQKTTNLYRTTVEAQGAAKTAYLLGTPGLKPRTTVATSPGRGLFSQDGRTWTVVGDQFYPLAVDLTTGVVTAGASLGTIPNDGAPVSWASNGDGGQQLAIVGGGVLKVLNLVTNVLSAGIVLPLTKAPVMIGYLDGYFVLSEANSPILWFSAIENGSSWDALDFFTRSTASDHVVGMVCANSRVWVMGSETSEAYEDVGDADNPFQPIKGSLFQIGCAGPWTISVGVNTLRWVGRSARSSPAIYRLDSYSGTRITTHAIDADLGKATTLLDAEAFTYEQDGHLFYALTCPSLGVAGVTKVYDETEQQWHDRSRWNTTLGREEMWRVRGHACVGLQHLVGSRDSGSIWALDLDTYDDDGAILRAVRRAPYLGSANDWAWLDRIELGCEVGVGLALTATTAYPTGVIADGAIGYWRLGDAFGATTAADSSSGGHPGTVNGAVTFGQASALPDGNTAALFTGAIGTYISVATAATLLTPGAFSWEAWMQDSDGTGKDMMFLSDSTSTNYLRVLGTHQLRVSATIGGVQTNVDDPAAIVVGTWYHVVATYDGATLKLYKNGVLVASSAVTGVFTGATSPLLLGRYNGSTGFEWNGLLDDVAIYPTALSASQVAAHYARRLVTLSDPQVELRISKDSGKTWCSAGTASIGKLGETDSTGCFWTRLGRVRVDRLVLEVVITDPVKRALGPGLWITATPGKRSQAAA